MNCLPRDSPWCGMLDSWSWLLKNGQRYFGGTLLLSDSRRENKMYYPRYFTGLYWCYFKKTALLGTLQIEIAADTQPV